MHRIPAVAKMLGVRKQSVYRRLDCPELAGHVHDTEGGKLLDDKGIEILRVLLPISTENQGTHSYQSEQSTQSDDGLETKKRQPGDYLGTEDGHLTEKYIKSVETERDFLKSVISEKDKQIAEKDKQIDNLTQIAKNSQVLLKQEQERSQLLLEAAQAPQEAPRGFFSRVFKKQ